MWGNCLEVKEKMLEIKRCVGEWEGLIYIYCLFCRERIKRIGGGNIWRDYRWEFIRINRRYEFLDLDCISF